MLAWETRKRNGYPIREDWQEGRCLGPDDLARLKDGDRVQVTWGGGNGPHVYAVKREHEDVLACSIERPELPAGYPGTIHSGDGRDRRGLIAWVERSDV